MCSSLGLVESHCEGAKTGAFTQKLSMCQGLLLLISDGVREVTKPLSEASEELDV